MLEQYDVAFWDKDVLQGIGGAMPVTIRTAVNTRTTPTAPYMQAFRNTVDAFSLHRCHFLSTHLYSFL